MAELLIHIVLKMENGRFMDNLYEMRNTLKQQYKDIESIIVNEIGIDNYNTACKIRNNHFKLIQLYTCIRTPNETVINELKNLIPDIDTSNSDTIKTCIDQELGLLNTQLINILDNMYEEFSFTLPRINAELISLKFQLNGFYGKN